ncbi:GGDEF domain-containing protein [Streptomyces sp. JH002]|uniref:GGDEF domain-containing protein n=1 Tax=Streptomyces sp. JH002 TaxID=2763259 RepID=UPI003D807E6E
MDLPALAAAVPLAGWALHSSVLTHRLNSARRDPLTGLHTRAGWTARAERLVRRPAALVLLVDLDGFKLLNDHYGHPAGDAALTAAAFRLSAWCGQHGIAGRLGGDEFVAVLTDLNRTPGLTSLTSALHTPVPYGDLLLPLAASIGTCAVADLPVPTLTDALAAADASMYAAKGHSSRNRH